MGEKHPGILFIYGIVLILVVLAFGVVVTWLTWDYVLAPSISWIEPIGFWKAALLLMFIGIVFRFKADFTGQGKE